MPLPLTLGGQKTASVTIRQLRAFVAVAEDGSITRAAQRLHLTPSALSMLIIGLEGELSVRLFERTTRRMALSEAGQELLPAISKVFVDLDIAFDALRQFSDRRSGRFAVATSPLLAATLLPGLLASFRERFPAIRVDILDLPVDGIAQAVRSGQADFGVCTIDTDPSDLVISPLYQDRLMLACPEQHPLAQQASVRWSDLTSEPLIWLRSGSGLRRLVEQGFAQAGEAVAPAFEVANVTTAMGLIEAGLGISILPAYALRRTRAVGVKGVPLTTPVLERSIVALTAQGRALSAPCQSFLSHFQSGIAAQDASMAAAEPGAAKATPAKRTRRKTS
ncbi:LysR family transcriptional regulator [Variovorax sp. HJSM1_2]|uniref:LysR family transcriptional regulator n=1 Tax=Variovorax sp. HJSM1_2 TaxID=3366263 RepID=UPI003BEC3BF2